ncbi:MAG: D-alanyl-D-alanine carboxypeptidase family protein [Clostridia bacterium]|nr:D-alanyl-D-alanine carboxypeptidase family protein [Clostridia bacterium]
MKKLFIRILSIIITVSLVLVSTALPVFAKGMPVEIKSEAAILIDVNTGRVLAAQQEHKRVYPASVTKIMSLLLVAEAIDAGRIQFDTEVTASHDACAKGGSQIWLKEGEVMTVDELLRASFIASANDACAALAELVAGSETAFVQMMNDRAAELSMKDTYFENCTGLDDDTEKHLTSAYDIAIMSRELLKHKWVTRYSTVWMDTLRDGATELTNTNKLVRFYEGTTGLKTGTTSKAGSCLSASAERNGTHLLAVVMGAPTSDVRFADAKALLNWGFANYTAVRLAVDPSLVVPVNVRHSTVKSVMPEICGEKKALVEQKYKDGIEQKITLPVDVEAPVSKKQVLGKVEFFANNELIGTVNLVSPIEIVEISFFDAVISFLGSLSK